MNPVSRRTVLGAAGVLAIPSLAVAQTGAEPTMQTAEIEGVKLSYAKWSGVSPPIVFLHGLSGSWQGWEPVVGLRGPRRAYAYDARGHGDSGRSPGKYTFAQQGRDATAFVEEVVGEPAILIGHSLGGMVAIWAAAHRPELVKAAVLEDPPLYSGEGPPGMNARIFQSGRDNAGKSVAFYLSTGVSQSYAEALARVDPAVYDEAIDDSIFTDWNTDEFLAQIKCPTLICKADSAKGSAIRPGQLERAAALIENVTTIQFPGAPHQVHNTQPAKFETDVSAWLEQVAPADS